MEPAGRPTTGIVEISHLSYLELRDRVWPCSAIACCYIKVMLEQCSNIFLLEQQMVIMLEIEVFIVPTVERQYYSRTLE